MKRIEPRYTIIYFIDDMKVAVDSSYIPARVNASIWINRYFFWKCRSQLGTSAIPSTYLAHTLSIPKAVERPPTLDLYVRDMGKYGLI